MVEFFSCFCFVVFVLHLKLICSLVSQRGDQCDMELMEFLINCREFLSKTKSIWLKIDEIIDACNHWVLEVFKWAAQKLLYCFYLVYKCVFISKCLQIFKM